MKMQARIWLVVTCLILAAGVVYALSTNTPSKLASNPTTSSSTAESSATTKVAAEPSTSPAPTVSLTPDLSHTDAYEFLDPVRVGKAAPDFTAKTADGKRIHLADFKGKKNLVLVFYQGSFCSVCGAQLANIQSHLSDFKNQDAEVIAISADDEAHAMQSVGEHGLTFNVVPDPDKKIIQKYGIANVSKRGIAWPSLFVVDKKGLVKLSFASQEGHRMHSNEILPVLSQMTGKPVRALSYDN
jgi:peroxiredoxin (alkyl hydroperoxide reductase subunit C)